MQTRLTYINTYNTSFNIIAMVSVFLLKRAENVVTLIIKTTKVFLSLSFCCIWALATLQFFIQTINVRANVLEKTLKFITFRNELGVFLNDISFPYFSLEMKIEPINTNCHILAFESPKLLFHAQYLLTPQQPKTSTKPLNIITT